MIHNGRRKLPYDPEEALAHLRAADPKLGALIDRVEPPAASPSSSATPARHSPRCWNRSSISSSRQSRRHHPQTRPPHLCRSGETNQHPIRKPCSTRRTSSSAPPASPATRSRPARPRRPHPRRHRSHPQNAILKPEDAEIIERLTAVRGIGTWTVEMLLIFRLGRPDVFPVTDYGVRKGFALTFQRIPNPAPSPPPTCPSRSHAQARQTLGALPLRRRLVSCGAPAIWMRPAESRPHRPFPRTTE
jgi:DNA-3-methyladenine glycosylase II